MVQTPASVFLEYAELVRAEVEAALQQCTDLDEDCPSRLREAMRHSLLAPGKRLRPMLVLMAAGACGSDTPAGDARRSRRGDGTHLFTHPR